MKELMYVLIALGVFGGLEVSRERGHIENTEAQNLGIAIAWPTVVTAVIVAEYVEYSQADQ